MKDYYLAIDIGASSGRHILACIEDEKLTLEEIYRFENNLERTDDGLVWNIERLFQNVLLGLRRCKELKKEPKSVAIDTWGVDYVLLDENKNELKPCYCYRDSRTKKTVEEVEKIVSAEKLYSKTGIQKQNINTIYQLYSDKESGKLDKASRFLMMPEYLSFKLTGVEKNEYTEATTTGLVNALKKAWDGEIISALGFPEGLFKSLETPCSLVGEFSSEVQAEVGFNSNVVFAPSHDTASAVCACPMGENDLYISSGTWSLIGTEIKEPILKNEARAHNFTNEGGIDFRFRFLKNYMGMWLLQSIRRDIDKSMSYDDMMLLAESTGDYELIDVNDDMFVAPENMVQAIREYIGKPDASLGYVINCVYHSLANSYVAAVREIEEITKKSFESIHIVGGGCRDKYLNRLTKEYTGKTVTAGPVEATATGNVISQIMRDKGLTLEKARHVVKRSFEIKEV